MKWSPETILAPSLHNRSPSVTISCNNPQFLPELALFPAGDDNVQINEIRFDGVVISSMWTTPSTGSACWNEGQHLPQDQVLAAQHMSDPAEPLARQFDGWASNPKLFLCFRV